MYFRETAIALETFLLKLLEMGKNIYIYMIALIQYKYTDRILFIW